jgi:hypothetical protein
VTDNDRDPALAAVFDAAQADLPEGAFVERVMHGVDVLHRRAVAQRVGMGLLFSLLAMPLQDMVIPLTHVLVQSLIEVDNRLLAEMLAPVNTVGGALSFVLLALRAGHKRLFT